MEKQKHHEELITGISKQLGPILEKSAQAIYIYLDDTHKVCNGRLADLLGYKSAQEWAATEAPLADVVEKDQQKVIKAYENATEKMMASNIEVTMKNIKTGNPIKTSMIMAPMIYDGHVFSLQFLSKL
ncbi:MAG: hypothetical protein ACYDHZ_04155 [Dehalococcoidia bacterium]